MKVDFFVAGTQKAGTTALDAYLRRHPALQMASRKELHHFDNEAIDWANPDHSRLHAEFDWSTSDVLRGESTPVYTFWPPSLARIQVYNPAARLILLFRDPVERAYSHWRMEVSRNAERLTFSEAIREGRSRLDPSTPLAQTWRVASYVERGFYAAQARRALQLFPHEQLFFLSSNDLAHDPVTTLQRVTGFLGIAPFENAAPISEHVGSDGFGRMSPFDAAYLRGMYRDDLKEFAVLTGLDVSGWCTPTKQAPAE